MKRESPRRANGEGSGMSIAADFPSHSTTRTPRPTLIGVSRAGERVQLWAWSEAAGVTRFGFYAPAAAREAACDLLRKMPGAEVFVQRGVML